MKISEKQHISNAAKHYKHLFSLPEYYKIISLLILISFVGNYTAFSILSKSFHGLYFAVEVLLLPTIIENLILSTYIFKNHILFNKRRITGISLCTSILWVLMLNLGAGFQIFSNIPHLFKYLTFFLISLTVSFRYLIFITVAQLTIWQLSLAVLLQPMIGFCFLILFWDFFTISVFISVFFSSILLCISLYFIVQLINKKGEKIIGVGTISLFQGFILNWVASKTNQLEEVFENIGVESRVLVSLLAFRNNNSIKSIIVVPIIHPGPFKNLGSSNLPYVLQSTLEKHFNNIVLVAHGTCSHESNLTSQKQCKKVVQNILKLAHFNNFNKVATKFIRVQRKMIQASCQIFGNVALVTITSAPASMEDIPKNIGVKIQDRGRKLGLKEVIIIDAHNSLGQSEELITLSSDVLNDIVFVAEKALINALKEEKKTFKIGVAKIYPKEYGIKDGIGPGGIIVLIVVVDRQKAAYVIIDGNNMISGFREQILESLREIIDYGEVLTTDTHAVNAILTVDRGYYAVGEAVDKQKIISYVKEAAAHAMIDVDYSESSFINGEMLVKVFGEKIIKLSMLINSVYKYLKRLIVFIYIPSLIVTLVVFIILYNL